MSKKDRKVLSAKTLGDYLERYRPLCFVCKKPVDRFDRYRNENEDTFKFIVECHGDREEMIIDREIFCKWDVKFERGFAFLNKYLPKEQDKIE